MVTPRKVLIVDDDQDGAASLGLLLEIAGHTPTVCFAGQEAMETLRTARPQIVLLDLSMPVVDGYDLCRHIRSLPWGDAPYVFALTGWMHVEQDALAAGFDGCLLKPCSMEQLSALLENPDAKSKRPRGSGGPPPADAGSA